MLFVRIHLYLKIVLYNCSLKYAMVLCALKKARDTSLFDSSYQKYKKKEFDHFQKNIFNSESSIVIFVGSEGVQYFRSL